MPIDELHDEIAELGILPPPRPLISPPSRRSSHKYCYYHGSPGHLTSECFDLRDEIEKLIRDGHLDQYKKGQDTRAPKPRDPQPRAQQPRPVIHTIMGGPYIGGTSRRGMKNFAREARGRSDVFSITTVPEGPRYDITFSDQDAQGVTFPHADALVIEATVGNFEVKRILIDNGASTNVLHHDCLVKMGFSTRNLEPCTRPIYGFTGNCLIPEGVVKLPVTMGDGDKKATSLATFVVIKGSLKYNAVLGRPFLVDVKAITSVYHQVIKFPTSAGVGQVRSDQYFSRQTYRDALHQYEHPRAEVQVVMTEDLDSLVTGVTGR